MPEPTRQTPKQIVKPVEIPPNPFGDQECESRTVRAFPGDGERIHLEEANLVQKEGFKFWYETEEMFGGTPVKIRVLVKPRAAQVPEKPEKS